MTQQQTGEMLAQDIIGTNVRNAQNESIGSVSDLVLDDKGQLKGAVVSVGGFLGIGDKKVAVPWDQVQVRAASGSSGTATGTGGTAAASQDPVLMVNMTKDQLMSRARQRNISGRSSMSKGELISALRK